MARLVRGMAAGLLAGLAASWVMNQFAELQPVHPPHGNGGRPKRKGRARPSKQQSAKPDAAEDDATGKTAVAISRKVFHHDLSPREKQIAGPLVHYGYGSLIGAVYGGLAELLPFVSAGLGLPFAFVLWLLGDEVAVPALGLAKPPMHYPPAVHADALSAHFMYGLTVDLLRRVLRHLL